MKVRDLGFDVIDDAVIGGGRGAEDGHFGRQQPKQAHNAAVVGTKVVSPIGNAVRFIHDEHADTALNERKQLLEKLLIAQPLGRDHEQVHLIGVQRGFDFRPL